MPPTGSSFAPSRSAMSGSPRSITPRTAGRSSEARCAASSPRLEHPDRVEVVAVLADHIQLAAVRALQLPRRGDEQLDELLALSGLGHEFAHHAESSHHASFR